MAREVLRNMSYVTTPPSTPPLSSPSSPPLSPMTPPPPTQFVPSLLSYQYIDEKGVFHRAMSTPSIVNTGFGPDETYVARQYAHLVKQWIVLHLTDHWSKNNYPHVKLVKSTVKLDHTLGVDLFIELSMGRCTTSEGFHIVDVYDRFDQSLICTTWVEKTLYDMC